MSTRSRFAYAWRGLHVVAGLGIVLTACGTLGGSDAAPVDADPTTTAAAHNASPA